MIYITCLIFPVVSIVCGIASLGALVKFVVEIQKDIRNHNT